MRKRRITIALPEDLIKKIDERGYERPVTIAEDLQNLYLLEKYTLDELKGKFSREELYLLVDALNGWLYTPRPDPKDSLYMELEDAINLNLLDKKWSVDKEKLLEKVKNLTSFQAHVLITYVLKAWQENKVGEVIELLGDN